MPLKKAVKRNIKLRLALAGPPGSGKTMTSLKIATALVERYGGRIAVIDTEHDKADLYANLYDFDKLDKPLTNFHPQNYIAALKEIRDAGGYTVVIIDSLSHAWNGVGGVLEIVDKAGGDNKFMGWQKGTPWQNALIETVLAAPFHIIATMRTKQEHVQEADPNKPGRTRIVNMGAQPVQRDGVEYEFDVVAMLGQDISFTVTKTRCPALIGMSYQAAGADVARILADWMDDGAPALTIAAPVAAAPTPVPAQGAVEPPATKQQLDSIGKLYQALGLGDPPEVLTYAVARQMLVQLSDQARQRKQPQSAPQRPEQEPPDADEEEWAGPETQEAWDAEAEQEEAAPEEPAAAPAAPAALPPFPATAIPAAADGDKAINQGQVTAITKLCSQRKVAVPEHLQKLTDKQARAVIAHLQKVAAAA